MLTASALLQLQNVKHALQLLSVLQLTQYLWPPSAEIADGQCFDFIVVGAGTAGSVVASRLSEDPYVSVLLIEAGGDPPIESDIPSLMVHIKNSSSDWNYLAKRGQNSSKGKKVMTSFLQGKMLGGTSGVNYLHYGQGHYSDYNKWADITDDDTWRWENVLPYFKKAETFDDHSIVYSPAGHYHGVEGPIGLTKENKRLVYDYLEAFQEIDIPVKEDLNLVDGVGYAPDVYNVRDGHRQSSGYSYLTLAKDRQNLFVWKNALVTKVLFEDTTAVAVEVVKNVNGVEKKFTVKALKEIILSAGAINSPVLLMKSGVGPKEHLKSHGIPLIADLPVGKNLQDHTGVIVVINMTKFVESAPVVSPYDFPAVTFRGSVSLRNSEYPDYLTWNYINYPDQLLNYCLVSYDFNNTLCDDLVVSPVSTQMLYSVISGLHPKSRGEVLLSSPSDCDPPEIYTGTLVKEDLHDLVIYLQDFIRVVNSTFFRSAGAEIKYPSSEKCNCGDKTDEDYMICYTLCMASDQHHYCGTNSMGQVVDGRLRVYGLNNLRVIDASVIPVAPSTGPLGPIVALAEKAADFIRIENDC